jgi:hypothetical protein
MIRTKGSYGQSAVDHSRELADGPIINRNELGTLEFGI